MKTWDSYPPLLTVKQAMELLSLTRRQTITGLCRRGELPACQIGAKWYIDRDRLRQKFAPDSGPQSQARI